jgi:hypothetical protein
LEEKVAAAVEKTQSKAVGTRCAHHATPQKLALTSPTSGRRLVDIARSQTKGHGVCLFCFVYEYAMADLRFSGHYAYFPSFYYVAAIIFTTVKIFFQNITEKHVSTFIGKYEKSCANKTLTN